MEFVDESKNIVGFDMDLITAIAKDQEFEVEIKNTAWDGIFAGLEGGAYDGILSSVTITDERKKKYDFSDPYFDANQAVVVRADDSRHQDRDGLWRARRSARRSARPARSTSVTRSRTPTLKQYDTPDLAMLDLLNKNIDAVIVDTPVAANLCAAVRAVQGQADDRRRDRHRTSTMR